MFNSISIEVVSYLSPMALIFLVYVRSKSKKHKANSTIKDDAIKASLTEPASLHPLIDQGKCMGCGSCATACPENDHNVLGIIAGKVELINPTHCIGHGACKTACPFDAIKLVFGTATRGIDIPIVSPNFETNVPGIFIAGELGGMGLIRNAIEQGRQAMEAIKKSGRNGSGDQLDVVVIGAGPSGFSASLSAMENKLRCVTLEQEALGGTVSHFPRGKLVMTAPAKLPMYGMTNFKETTKEILMEFWEDVENVTGVKINYMERMEDIVPEGNGFVVTTPKGSYRTRSVLLSIGRRGTPRKLGVPGEECTKVVYRLVDPQQYQNQNVLIVGGGDSALEAATSIAEETNSKVTISYRSGSFSRAKEKNRQRVDKAVNDGILKVLMNSNVKEVLKDTVKIDQEGNLIEIPNDGIIVSAGGILPTPFLKKIGIIVETKHGTE